MNVKLIHIFLAVYRTGSFAAVAEEENVAPSSISRAISKLEDRLAVRLFNRTTRTLSPTEAGDLYYHKVAPLIEELYSSEQEIADHAQAPSGRLRVTASVSFGQLLLIPLIKEFKTLHPGIELDLYLTDHRTDIIGEKIDIAIRHGDITDNSLIVRKLMDVQYLLAASPAYLGKHDPIEKPEDLAKHSLISFTLEDYKSFWRFQKPDHTFELPIHSAISVSNASAIRALLKDDLGIALLANWTIASDLSDGTLMQVLPTWDVAATSFNQTISLVMPSRAYTPMKTRVFIDFLSEKLNQARPI